MLVGGSPPGVVGGSPQESSAGARQGLWKGKGTGNLAGLRGQDLGKLFGVGVLQIVDVICHGLRRPHVEFRDQVLDGRHIATRGNEYHVFVRVSGRYVPTLGTLARRACVGRRPRLRGTPGCGAPSVPAVRLGSAAAPNPSIAVRQRIAICSPGEFERHDLKDGRWSFYIEGHDDFQQRLNSTRCPSRSDYWWGRRRAGCFLSTRRGVRSPRMSLGSAYCNGISCVTRTQWWGERVLAVRCGWYRLFSRLARNNFNDWA